MTPGDKTKRAAADAESMTQRVVDVVQGKVDDATEAVRDAVADPMDRIHMAVGGDAKK